MVIRYGFGRFAAFARIEWVKPRKISVRTAGNQVEFPNGYVPNKV
jgi:hypothetical protein